MLGHWVVWCTGLHTRNITLRASNCVLQPIDGPEVVADIFDLFTLAGPIAIIRKPKRTVRWRWNYWHYSLQINTFIQSASKMLRQTSGVSSSHQNKENRFMWMYVRKHLVFQVQPNNVLTSVLQIFMCGVTKKPLVYSVPIENEETLHKHVFDVC
jgi:hypothetical protein